MAEAKRKAVEVRRGQFAQKVDVFASRHTDRTSIPTGDLDEFHAAFDSFVPDVSFLDWDGMVRSVSTDLKEPSIRTIGYGGVSVEVRRKRQRIVCKLAAMQFVFRGTLTENDRTELNRLYTTARTASTAYFDEQVEKLIRRVFCVDDKNIVRDSDKGCNAREQGEKRRALPEQEKRRACKEALYAQWNPFYKAKIKFSSIPFAHCVRNGMNV